jgi:hypothetical protein
VQLFSKLCARLLDAATRLCRVAASIAAQSGRAEATRTAWATRSAVLAAGGRGGVPLLASSCPMCSSTV